MNMDEMDIKALYRQHTQTRGAVLDAQAAEDIAATLSQHGWSADEVAPLDRVASSAAASDIARIVAALGPDIDALARDVQHVRAPRHGTVSRFVRRGFALAAGIGAFAVVFSLLPSPRQAPGAIDHSAHDPGSVIMAVSFEGAEDASPGERASRAGTETIFQGNFDS